MSMKRQKTISNSIGCAHGRIAAIILYISLTSYIYIILLSRLFYDFLSMLTRFFGLKCHFILICASKSVIERVFEHNL